jgi:hypothetical protein
VIDETIPSCLPIPKERRGKGSWNKVKKNLFGGRWGKSEGLKKKKMMVVDRALVLV